MYLKNLLAHTKIINSSGDLDTDISAIAYDSRKVTPGCLFVAVPGAVYDGTRFIPQALDRGAKAFITEKEVDFGDRAVKIVVKNARSVLADISAAFYGFPSSKLKVIGITGTNGKTTTSYLVESILRCAGHKTALIGTVGARIGDVPIPTALTTPESLELQELFSQMVRDGVSHVVMEVSSHSIAMKRIRGVDFDCAVYTNLSHDHLDFHKTMESYLDTKLKLFRSLGTGGKNNVCGVVNADDQYSEAFIEDTNGKLITYSLDKKSDIKGEIISSNINGMELKISGKNVEIIVKTPLFGKFNAYNILAAFSAAQYFGIDIQKIREGIEVLRSVPGRIERITEGQDFEVIVDFAHSPDSLEKVIKESSAGKKGKTILVFGCTGDRDKLKRPVMGAIAGRSADFVILTSDDPHGEDPAAIIKDVEKGVLKSGMQSGRDFISMVDRKEAIKKSIEIAKPDDIVIIAGRGHEGFQEIKGVNIELDDRIIAREAIRAKLK